MSDKKDLNIRGYVLEREVEDNCVEMVEFGDLECPYCNNATFIIKDLLRAFGEKLSFRFINFPLTDKHPHAVLCACAAEAAHRQGKYWEMHALLFEHQKGINPIKIYELAKELELDADKFHADINDESVKAQVMADFEFGRQIGVTGTPTFYLNGEKHFGDWTFKSLYDDIQKHLA